MVENDRKYKFEIRMREIEKWHPHQLIFYLAMVSSASVFCFLMILFWATHESEMHLYLSRYFVVSTILILSSSILVHRLDLLFAAEKLSKIRNTILLVIFLGSLFSVTQLYGWRDLQLNEEEVGLFTPNLLIYIISGFHFLHTIIMTFFSLSYLKTYSKMVVNPIEALLRSSNPYELTRLKLFAQGWHYIGIVWVMILTGMFLI